jgi:hypothetical protein
MRYSERGTVGERGGRCGRRSNMTGIEFVNSLEGGCGQWEALTDCLIVEIKIVQNLISILENMIMADLCPDMYRKCGGLVHVEKMVYTVYWQRLHRKRVKCHRTTFWRQIRARPSTFPVLFPYTGLKSLVPAVLSHFQKWTHYFGVGNRRPQISRFWLSFINSDLI